MTDREIYLARLYMRKRGWRLTILEVINFETENNWSLLAIGWDKENGLLIEVAG